VSEREGLHTPAKGPDFFPPGFRLGPYEIVGALGAGGMGTVYRAHDSRLRRDVALKVISASFVRADSVERFEREARAAAALNHPNILAVFDVNIDGPVPYVVSELLEGESLRARIDRGPVPYRRALEWAIQIAQALAAAHAKRIYHRDVKPGNVFLMGDGRVKLLDFGLAKLPPPDSADLSQQSTTPELSHPGRALGTAAYMSPEQVLGQEVDHRCDIFALGSVLYEMLTGARAFQRPTAVETMSAVLRDDPPDVLVLNPATPPGAAAAVRRCLEKNPEERFQSARDLAFHLTQLLQSTSGSYPLPPLPTRRRRVLLGVALVAAVLAAALPWLLVRPPPAPSFEQLTFHRGRIGGARFTDAGVVYSQTRELEPPTVSLKVRSSPETRSLYEEADVLAFCAGELALSVGRRFVKGDRFAGTLATAPSVGGKPHPTLENVEDADCDAAGRTYAVARAEGFGAESTLEYPVGKVLYRTAGSLHGPRISRDGRYVAVFDDPAGIGTGGHVVIVDRDGRVVRRTREWANARGMAWAPRGGELWFTASATRSNRSLYALRLDGRERLVLETAGSLTIRDTAEDGRVLLTREDERTAVVGVPPGGTSERDLSWFDNAGLAAVSASGRTLLFGDRFGIYLRGTDGAPATRLGTVEGYPDDLSPDGTTVLATNLTASGLFLAPTGPGAVRDVPVEGLEAFRGSVFFPDGRRLLVTGRAPGHRLRSYVVDLPGGRPRPITDEDTWGLTISPDGTRVAATSVSGPVSLWPVAGGRPRVLAGSEPGDRPVSWTADGRSLWIFRRGEVPAHVSIVDVETGRRTPWKTLVPPDAAGVYSVNELKVTPSGNAYFYSYRRTLSELYEVHGLH
jgi:eukaryotic-like serine/threonine-protein kinase